MGIKFPSSFPQLLNDAIELSVFSDLRLAIAPTSFAMLPIVPRYTWSLYPRSALYLRTFHRIDAAVLHLKIFRFLVLLPNFPDRQHPKMLPKSEFR